MNHFFILDFVEKIYFEKSKQVKNDRKYNLEN